MKKILFISLMNGAPWGGSEILWSKLALWMADNGYDVDVCVYDWNENKQRLKAWKEKGLGVILMPKKKGWLSSIRLRKTLKSIDFEKYDFVFVNQGGYKEIAYPPFDQLWQRMKRYALASHNYDESEKLGDKKRLALMNWTSHAQLQVGASERIFEMLSRKFGIPRTRQEVWTNPISFNSPATVPTYPGPLHGNYIFSMLAELDIHRKAQDLLIRALSSEKWSNRNWELHLFGTGRDKESLAALIAEKKMENKIFLKGFTPDPQKALEETHVLLQCTRIDAMPVSVVEAMALGRPCVVSAVGDMPLWISEAHNGFVCRNLTVEAIDDVLEKCWSKKEKWAEIGKNAFETFQSKYPAPFEKAMVRKIIDLLSSSPAHVKDDPGQ